MSTQPVGYSRSSSTQTSCANPHSVIGVHVADLRQRGFGVADFELQRVADGQVAVGLREQVDQSGRGTEWPRATVDGQYSAVQCLATKGIVEGFVLSLATSSHTHVHSLSLSLSLSLFLFDGVRVCVCARARAAWSTTTRRTCPSLSHRPRAVSAQCWADN